MLECYTADLDRFEERRRLLHSGHVVPLMNEE